MNAQVLNAWSMLLATDAPVLPPAWLMQMNLQLSWSVVLACLGCMVLRRWTKNKPAQGVVAMLLVAWAWLPGAYSVSYWLGLAFHAPSVTAVLLCTVWLSVYWVRGSEPLVLTETTSSTIALAVLGVLLGWALLLDTLALLPLQLYAFGFSTAAPVLLMVVVLLPWVWFRDARNAGAGTWLLPLVIVLFVGLRLPSGNVWDAILDPWLWLAIQGCLLRRIYVRYEARTANHRMPG